MAGPININGRQWECSDAYMLGYMNSSKCTFDAGASPRIQVVWDPADGRALGQQLAHAFRAQVGGLGSVEGPRWIIHQPAELRRLCRWVLERAATLGSEYCLLAPVARDARQMLHRLDAEAPDAPAPAGGTGGGAGSSGTASAPTSSGGAGASGQAAGAGGTMRSCAACGAEKGAGGKLYRQVEGVVVGRVLLMGDGSEPPCDASSRGAPPCLPCTCRCGACRQLSFCGRDCQRRLWEAGHKRACPLLHELAEAPPGEGRAALAAGERFAELRSAAAADLAGAGAALARLGL